MKGDNEAPPEVQRSNVKLLGDVAGLWLNIPDYDAPTQMVKPHERNTRYVDAVMTIPKVAWLTLNAYKML